MDNKNKSYNLDEIFMIADKIESGEKVLCKICKKPLSFRKPGSGYHPGLFCPTGCTEVYMDFGKKE